MWNRLKELFKRPQALTLPQLRLFHFTHIRLNLPLILKDRSILSYQLLVKKYGYENAISLMHDLKRYDFLSNGKNYVNCAIGRAPANYLYRISGKNWRNEWVAIEIDTKIFNWLECIVAPLGAASYQSNLIPSKPDQWKISVSECFKPIVGAIKRPKYESNFDKRQQFPDDIPTHPNCEILIPNEIPFIHWKNLVTFDYAVRQTVRIIVEKSGIGDLSIITEKDIFQFHPVKLTKE